MHNLHLRNIDDDLMLILKQKAIQKAMSMNKLILMLLKTSVDPMPKRTAICHDFDEFSGSWSLTECKTLEKNMAYFSEIDKELWK